MAMTSCAGFFPLKETVVAPGNWHSRLIRGISEEDPACFIWWRALDDPILTELIEEAAHRNSDVQIAAALNCTEKILETMNKVTGEIASHYLRLRGFQSRLSLLEARIGVQQNALDFNQGLSTTGFINTIEQNESQKTALLLSMQKTQIEQSIDKMIFHLSTLLSYPPCGLYEILIVPKPLPKLPVFMPVGYPQDLKCNHDSVREAAKQYRAMPNKLAFYNYQKQFLSALEDTENALTALHDDLKVVDDLQTLKNVKAENYQLMKELNSRGLKGDLESQGVLLELLSEESDLVEAKVNLLLDYVSLYQSLGVGWEVSHCIKGNKKII